MTSLAKFDITAEEIATVVQAFYAGVREHPTLAPVFAAHVKDWPSHEEKIVRFWENAILQRKVYDGNPVRVHNEAGNVRPGMFGPWLELFDATLTAKLRPEQAAAWSALAHRIGASLRAGVTERTRPGEVPILR